MLGKKIELEFKRKKVDAVGKTDKLLNYKQVEEEKEITIQINLRTLYLPIKREGDRYFTRVRVGKIGNEEIVSRANIWGDIEQLPIFGDLYVDIEFEVPPAVEIVDNYVLQRIEVPLYKVLLKGEKVRMRKHVAKHSYLNDKRKENSRMELAEFYLNLSKDTLSNFDKNVEDAENDIDDLQN